MVRQQALRQQAPAINMIHCKKTDCKFEAWRRRLCYRHWRESQGFVFDPQLKVFVHAKSITARGEILLGNSRGPDKVLQFHATPGG